MYINDATRGQRKHRSLNAKGKRDLVQQGLAHAYDMRRSQEERKRLNEQAHAQMEHMMTGLIGAEMEDVPGMPGMRGYKLTPPTQH